MQPRTARRASLRELDEDRADEVTDFDLKDFLPYLLNQAAEQAGLSFQRIYKARYGMLRTEWRVLFHLGRYGPMTAKAIGMRTRMHKTKISRAVSALEARRFLTRTQLENDRRLERLELSAAGRRAYADLSAHAQAHDADLMGQFTTQEQAVLRRCLGQLAGF
ncbi:MarR family transcriptional regulator [Breoghania sp.]|uniref:MarR family winged helix-turn-helix transcriptional regulator n=1 Tax=Breoghania sp. TaxID=2065378 RepID=UPI002AA63167|nr:MarR family transcriptional regulator [Breoghania sp.]